MDGMDADAGGQNPGLIWVLQIQVSRQADDYGGVAFDLPSDAALSEVEFLATDRAKTIWN